MTDTMRHFFYNGANYDRTAYDRRRAPYMQGFVWNQGNHDTMKTFTPEKLPIFNGLAQAFAISDEWFCSMPGATNSQRAFALTGSALGQLNNFMNGPQYTANSMELGSPSDVMIPVVETVGPQHLPNRCPVRNVRPIAR